MRNKCGRVFTIVRLCMQLNAKQNQYYPLHLDISCFISSPVAICRKNQSFIYWKNMKTVSLCHPVFLCTRHRAKVRREVTPPMKIIKKVKKNRNYSKKKKKKKLFQTWTYYLFIYYLTVYMSKFTHIMVNLII